MTMAEQGQTITNRIAGPSMPRPMAPAADVDAQGNFGNTSSAYTADSFFDYFGHYNWWGFVVFILRMYYPRYTAQTLLRVLPPVEKDPMTIAWCTGAEGYSIWCSIVNGYSYKTAKYIGSNWSRERQDSGNKLVSKVLAR